jgi:4-oxalocrotonate tautomerase
MPVVTVQAWEGRTVDQKRRLVEAITKAMVEIYDSTQQNTNILIYDVPKTNWGRDGKLSSDAEASAGHR